MIDLTNAISFSTHRRLLLLGVKFTIINPSNQSKKTEIQRWAEGGQKREIERKHREHRERETRQLA